jgi:drug/metabolite transporter (DMT)-like permease
MTRSPAARTGIALGLLSSATFATSGTFATSLFGIGWSAGAAVTFRVGIAALILLGPGLWSLRGRWGALRRSGGVLAGYGLLAVAGAQVCFFNAVRYLPVGVALLLEYLGLVLVVLWMWAAHGQRPRRLTLAGSAVAVAGLFCVLDISGHQHVSGVGALWGAGAAVGLALYYVLSARADDGLPALALASGGLLIGAVALAGAGLVGALPMRATFADVHLAGHELSWLIPIGGLSLVAAVVAYVTGISAARILGARLSSFLGLFEVVFAVLFAWLFVAQLPRPVQLAGGVLIIIGVGLVRLDEARPAPVVVVTPEEPALAGRGR